MSSMTANYEVLEVATGKLIRVNLFDLEHGLASGLLSSDFDPVTGQPNAKTKKAARNESDKT